MSIEKRETVHITGVSHQGEGVGRLADGRVVFVPGALPEEDVIIGDLAKEKKRLVAPIEEITLAHPERVVPACPVYHACGGCQLQHAAPALQKEIKTRRVQDACERIGHLDLTILPTLMMADPWRYRNKGIFHVNEAAGEARLGFYGDAGHAFVPATDCLLFSQAVNSLLKDLEKRITATGRAGHIRKVMVRQSFATGEIMLAFITEDQAFRLPNLAASLLADHPNLTSLWHNVLTNPRLATGRAWHHLGGQRSLSDSIGDLQVHLSPASFFQVNNRQAKVLYDQIRHRAALTGRETVLDLYGGIGTIGLYLARDAKIVIGVESIGDATRDARDNARQLGISNASFVTAKAETWLPRQLKDHPAPDLVIVDPPRKGLHDRLIDTLITSKTPAIIYVSCNPATLARDLKAFHRNGYQIHDIQPVDLFPQTAHVETVALLSKLDVDKHIDVEIKLDELDLTSAESKATYAQIKEYILEKFNLKVSTLYIAQIKRKCGIELREHYNKSKKEKQVIPQCTPEKEEAIMDALRHFKMI